jgi:hypothetical protein
VPAKPDLWPCQNDGVSRARQLRALLIAITVAGVGLPHLVAGETAGSLPSLLVGVVVGLGCLRLALAGDSRGGRALGVVGIVAAALAPLVGYVAQEAAEREPGLEAAHAEPSLFAAIATQAPLILLALIAVRLLIAAVAVAVRVLTRPTLQLKPARARSGRTKLPGAALPRRLALFSSNGQRAPPFGRAAHRLAPLG